MTELWFLTGWKWLYGVWAAVGPCSGFVPLSVRDNWGAVRAVLRGQILWLANDVSGGLTLCSVFHSHSRLQVLSEKSLMLMSLYKYMFIVVLKSAGSFCEIELHLLCSVSTEGWPNSAPLLFAAAYMPACVLLCSSPCCVPL